MSIFSAWIIFIDFIFRIIVWNQGLDYPRTPNNLKDKVTQEPECTVSRATESALENSDVHEQDDQVIIAEIQQKEMRIEQSASDSESDLDSAT
jgi:hypothetical protein